MGSRKERLDRSRSPRKGNRWASQDWRAPEQDPAIVGAWVLATVGLIVAAYAAGIVTGAVVW